MLLSQNTLAFREILKILGKTYLKPGYTLDFGEDLSITKYAHDIDIRKDGGGGGNLVFWFKFRQSGTVAVSYGRRCTSLYSRNPKKWNIPDVSDPNFDPEKWFEDNIYSHSTIGLYFKRNK